MKDQQFFTHNKAFKDALDAAVGKTVDNKHDSGLLVLAINNLSLILANYGNALVEEVLRQLEEDINKQIKGKGTAFRTDKNNISLLFSQLDDPLYLWAEKIHELIQRFGCAVAAAPIHLSASMGGVTFSDNATSAETLVEQAHIAVDINQKEQTGYYLAYADIGRRQLQAKHQMILANYMQQAIINKRLRLAYQPIIHSQTGHVMYHESLLRIVDENGKISSAGPFIPVAESLGFIDIIDDLVLDMVVAELLNSLEIMLAFNISNLTVNNPHWLAKAKRLLKDPDVASRVVVEMTETAMHGDLKKISYFIATLQGLGCQVAIDDFGAGYTSFRQLKALPVDIVKIDGYFVKDIVDDSDNRLFVKTLLDFTNGLGLKAVAEFVETGEIAKLLMELKVDYMQGNYFCPAVNYRSWIKEENYA